MAWGAAMRLVSFNELKQQNKLNDFPFRVYAVKTILKRKV